MLAGLSVCQTRKTSSNEVFGTSHQIPPHQRLLLVLKLSMVTRICCTDEMSTWFPEETLTPRQAHDIPFRARAPVPQVFLLRSIMQASAAEYKDKIPVLVGGLAI